MVVSLTAVAFVLKSSVFIRAVFSSQLSHLSVRVSAGDHVICGSYDCKLSWFDLDLSTKPYKMLRYVPASHSDHLSLTLLDMSSCLRSDLISRMEVRVSSNGGCNSQGYKYCRFMQSPTDGGVVRVII